jgi:hypothetical protein
MTSIQLGRCSNCDQFSAGYRFADDHFFCDGCVEQAVTEHFARLEAGLDLPTPEYFENRDRVLKELNNESN